MPALRTRDTQSRSLEVTTDAPAPPSLAIVSPTPRAFTFPVTHNLSSDSPSSSPSSSPFEPERDAFAFTNPFSSNVQIRGLAPVSIPTPPPFLPQQPYARPLTPDSLRSSSPTPSTKRRKSSASSETSERRPKKGDEDYIKRPENAFILFRRKCCEDRQAAAEEAAQLADGPLKKQRQADLSKTISQQWKSLSAEEKAYWENLAKEKKKEHELMYPNYVYRPQRQKDKDGRSKNKRSASKKRGREEGRDGEASVSFVVPVAPRHYGRSTSAPTPPPYQAIKIPQVYHLTPSAPTSPSLIPMITRQSSGSIDSMNNFDFVPTQSYVPPPFPSSNSLDASLQSAEFMRNMFTVPGQVRKPGPSPLQQLAMGMQQQSSSDSPSNSAPPAPPALHIISPASSISSGSSGPSSPTTGPFTPSSAPLDPNAFLAMANTADLGLFDFNNGIPTQAELDLQAEMQQQNDLSHLAWSDWPTAPAMLDNNWDVNSIPSALLGDQAMAFSAPNVSGKSFGVVGADGLCGTGLEFGHDFAQALEGGFDSNPLLGGYDDLMAGSAFAAAA
ncbi:specific transcriptional repressor [Coprinopsis cinerea AmutBmut pab1-1]|nr:specific transcriptional repressor [Coprinopsis cinerea AmutBmut pab1-1]